MAAAGCHQAGVALHIVYRVGCDAQFLGHDLAKSGFMALAGRGAADEHGHATVGIETDFGGVGGQAKRDFEIAGDTDATALALGLGGLASCGETAEVRLLERLAEGAGEVAAVDDHAERGLVRIACDEVLPAQFDRVETQFVCGNIDHPLEQVGRFGAAGAAVGV